MEENYQAYQIHRGTYETGFPVIVYSICYLSPIDSLKAIESELRGFEGEVLFDSLLSNGNSSNRYIKATYNGNQFDFHSFKVLTREEITEPLRKVTHLFYVENEAFLENSVLTSYQKKLIKKGIKLRTPV